VHNEDATGPVRRSAKAGGRRVWDRPCGSQVRLRSTHRFRTSRFPIIGSNTKSRRSARSLGPHPRGPGFAGERGRITRARSSLIRCGFIPLRLGYRMVAVCTHPDYQHHDEFLD
jgi:hypothetical protein